MFSVEVESVQDRTIPGCDEIVTQMSSVLESDPRPSVDGFDTVSNVSWEGFIEDVNTIVMTSETVGDVSRSPGVLVTLGIGGVCDIIVSAGQFDSGGCKAVTHCCKPGDFWNRRGLELRD